MAGEIIRMGDKTSHGGTVLEGSPTDICMGKPIAFIGHQTHCPKCKGTYPIIEGVLTTTFYGKGVAVAGMKTACGAVLLADQFTDIVEWSSGSGSAAKASAGAAEATAGTHAAPSGNGVQTSSENDDEIEIEYFYSLVDADGKPIDAYRYDLRMADVLHTKAGAYTNGETVTIRGIEPSRLVTWLNRDGGSRA
jgi:uncharacterized Zn-binding protein involved in type VI secretion